MLFLFQVAGYITLCLPSIVSYLKCKLNFCSKSFLITLNYYGSQWACHLYILKMHMTRLLKWLPQYSMWACSYLLPIVSETVLSFLCSSTLTPLANMAASWRLGKSSSITGSPVEDVPEDWFPAMNEENLI